MSQERLITSEYTNKREELMHKIGILCDQPNLYMLPVKYEQEYFNMRQSDREKFDETLESLLSIKVKLKISGKAVKLRTCYLEGLYDVGSKVLNLSTEECTAMHEYKGNVAFQIDELPKGITFKVTSKMKALTFLNISFIATRMMDGTQLDISESGVDSILFDRLRLHQYMYVPDLIKLKFLVMSSDQKLLLLYTYLEVTANRFKVRKHSNIDANLMVDIRDELYCWAKYLEQDIKNTTDEATSINKIDEALQLEAEKLFNELYIPLKESHAVVLNNELMQTMRKHQSNLVSIQNMVKNYMTLDRGVSSLKFRLGTRK